MSSSYLPVLFLFGLAILFPVGLLFSTALLGPRLSLRAKQEPYECGVPPVGSTREQLPVKFYRMAVLFLLFDVEAAFLFPWAVLFKNELQNWGSWFLLGELSIFLLILIVGYAYAWKKGALEWD